MAYKVGPLTQSQSEKRFNRKSFVICFDQVADPMALYDGVNRFNRVRDLNRNRNFPINRKSFVICSDQVAEPMALYDGVNRFNRVRDLNHNWNFPIDRTTFVICCD